MDLFNGVILPSLIIAIIIIMIYSKITGKPIKEVIKNFLDMFKSEEQ